MMFRPSHLPLITAVWLALTLIISYSLSVHNGHVYYMFPYISDTAALPPESCYFAQMLNVGVLLLLITLCVRYKQIKLMSEVLDLNSVHKWNSVSKWLACISCIGLDLVANFPETTVFALHIIGAILMFGLGSIYFLIQTRISYLLIKGMKGSPHRLRKITFYIRIMLSISLLPLFIITLVTSIISIQEFDGEHVYYWTPENKGYNLHLVATFCEWFVAIFMLGYVVTFTNEFKALKFHSVDFSINIV